MIILGLPVSIANFAIRYNTCAHVRSCKGFDVEKYVIDVIT